MRFSVWTNAGALPKGGGLSCLKDRSSRDERSRTSATNIKSTAGCSSAAHAHPSAQAQVLKIILAAQPRPQRHVRSVGDKYALDVGPSTIDGYGVFAGESIPARRKIGEIRGEPLTVKEARRLVKNQRRIMMVEVSTRTAIDASSSTHALRFTNHSCCPNAVLRISLGRIEIYALRELVAGEEITVDYGRDPP